MSIFPTTYSTLSAKALGEQVAEQYRLEQVECKLLLHGVSDTYLLSHAGGKYVLKVYRDNHRTRAEVEGEVTLLLHYKSGGGRVSVPLADPHGKYIHTLTAAEGLRYLVIFSFAPGRSEYAPNADQLRQIGQEMARLHQLGESFEMPHPRPIFDLHTTLDQPLQSLAPAFADWPEGLAILEKAHAAAHAYWSQQDTEPFAQGYIHFDYLPKNFHLSDDGELCFFDFDFAGQGWLVNDLMSFWMHYFFHIEIQGMAVKEAKEHFATFLKGYRSIKPVSEAELSAIPALGIGFWLFYLHFQYDQFESWSNIFWGPGHLRKYVGWIEAWLKMYDLG